MGLLPTTLRHLWSAGLKPGPSTLNPDAIFIGLLLKDINVFYVFKKGWLRFFKGLCGYAVARLLVSSFLVFFGVDMLQ